MPTPSTRIKWHEAGTLPAAGMQFWYQYEAGVSGHNIIYDYSGNNRTLQCNAIGQPVLTSNVLNGQPGWYFNGSSNELTWTGANFSVKHAFILAYVDEATFTASSLLLGGRTGGGYFTGEPTTTKYATTPGGIYYNNGVSYVSTNRQAPMLSFGIAEMNSTAAVTFSGGARINSGSFKGYVLEAIGWNRDLTMAEQRSVYQHFNLRYRMNEVSGGVIPLYFPSTDLVPTLATRARVFHRFNDIPVDWAEVTEEFEYEDKLKDFNEITDDAPRYWEYVYQNVPKSQKIIFDEFNNVARRANSFLFKDPEGWVWSNVRIDSYDRSHEEHMRWRHDVVFRLVGIGSTDTFEG